MLCMFGSWNNRPGKDASLQTPVEATVAQGGRTH